MIRFVAEEGKPVMEASLDDRIYLGNDSLIELSKGCVARQDRFVNSLQRDGSLLFPSQMPWR